MPAFSEGQGWGRLEAAKYELAYAKEPSELRYAYVRADVIAVWLRPTGSAEKVLRRATYG